jgi:tRNA(Ile)-lysidine synthase
MAAIGGWEAAPHLAIAVSGGPDSLALCLLAHAWAARQGGTVTALTVDHGLRPGSAAEARQVRTWLTAHGIDHRILTWPGEKPTRAIQKTARAARYDLLDEASRSLGCLHLLVGHHQDDQLETIRMRTARRPGGPGVAGMATITERTHCRILRPLLTVPKTALSAYLSAAGQPWIDDPSNRDPAYERTTLRGHPLPDATNRQLWRDARSAGHARQHAGRVVASLLARHYRVNSRGFASIDALGLAPSQNGRVEALAAAVTMIGGGAYSPAEAMVRDLADRIHDEPDFRGATLGGCQVRPVAGSSAHGRWLTISREAGRIAPPTPIAVNQGASWDNRFRLYLSGPDQSPAGEDFLVGGLGEAGWSQLGDDIRDAARHKIPEAARYSLPALFRNDELMAAPYLPFTKGLPPEFTFEAVFRPLRFLTDAGFSPFPALAGLGIAIV